MCVATYKRPEGLARLLESLAAQKAEGLRFRIVVVDNDLNGSAARIVEKFRHTTAIPVAYEIEPIRGIAQARNRSVRLAEGDFLAFVDDDEKVCERWLKELYECVLRNHADAALGPVCPAYPPQCPAWVKKGRFFERPPHKNDAPLRRGRTGNAMVRRTWFDLFENPFDPELGMSGNEDSQFFERLERLGAKFYWAENAKVTEYIEKDRLSVKWLLMRAFRNGQGFASSNRPRRLSGKVWHYLYRVCLFSISIGIFCLTLPFAFHVSLGWLKRAFSNLGQISIIFSYRYQEYRNR